MFKSLSGRFLILTIIFVMVAEILIFVPSIARFRESYINDRLERAQIASLAVEADSMLDMRLEAELLQTADIYNVVLRRDEVRQLALSSTIPNPVHDSYDMRDPSAWTLIMDAFACLVDPNDRVIRVLGSPVRDAGLLIEITMGTQNLRDAMLDYGRNILIISLVISVFTATLLFFAVRRVLVAPIRGVVGYMQGYAEAPEDARQLIAPKSQVTELREAEDALLLLQTQLTAALKQKDRLAQLGAAVAKISHDLRNILTSAQLFTDRIETS
ncbi:MAG: sensor histidine kinase, partial [Planktomarina sp.]